MINADRSGKIRRFDAIYSLVGGQLSGASDGTDIEYLDGQTPPSESDIDAKVAELQGIWDAHAYARTRKPLYPDIGDQLDDLYHAGAFSASMAAKLKKVKDDNPKG